MAVLHLTQGTDSRTLIYFAFALAISYVAYRVLFNVFFHPLRHYPGPWHRAASRFPYTCSIFRGDATHRVASIHERYGHVVRIAPDTLSYTCSQAWPDIYGSKQSNKRGDLPKDGKYYLRWSEEAATISTAADADHRRLRRLQSRSFSEKALLLQQPVLQQCVEKSMAHLARTASENNGSVDFTDWISCLTIDTIGELSFSENFGCVDAGELQPHLRTMFKEIKIFAFVREALRLPSMLVKSIAEPLLGILFRDRDAVGSFGEMVRDRRLALEGDRPDFMSHMLKDVGVQGKGMTHQELGQAATTFIVAGSETTATMISGAVYLLLSNPLILEELTSSLRADFESTEAFTYARLQQHEYLNAVLKESMRLYPPAPDMLFRSTGSEPTIVADRVVPPHTSLTVNLWAANRSSQNFHCPHEFLPERWLKDAPAEFQGDDRAAFNPFSVGPRDCLGKNLAWIEMRLILASLLLKFNLTALEDASREWIERQKIFFLWEKLPLRVRVSEARA